MSTIEFNQMLSTNQTILKGFAINFTRNLEDAEDLMQDTYLKALKYKDHFQDGTNFKGWLYTIMRNLFLNNCKKQKLVRNTFSQPGAKVNYNVPGTSANNIYQIINEKDINSSIDRLKDSLKVPFNMVMEGYLYEEIAEKMSVPTGTIKSRIFNARKELMKQLADFN